MAQRQIGLWYKDRFGEHGFFYILRSSHLEHSSIRPSRHWPTDTSTFRKRLKSVLFDRAYHWLLLPLRDMLYSLVGIWVIASNRLQVQVSKSVRKITSKKLEWPWRRHWKWRYSIDYRTHRPTYFLNRNSWSDLQSYPDTCPDKINTIYFRTYSHFFWKTKFCFWSFNYTLIEFFLLTATKINIYPATSVKSIYRNWTLP